MTKFSFNIIVQMVYIFGCVCVLVDMLPQNALRRDCNGKCIELIEGHYLAVMAEV